MKKIIYIAAALALVAIVVIRLKSNKETTNERVYHYDKGQAINVQTVALKLENAGSTIFYAGSFEPNKETKVSADIQGKINAVLVDAGSIVKKGQALVRLDNKLLQLQLQAIDVQVEGLENDLKRFTILANADAIQGVQREKADLGLRAAKVQRATLLEQISKTTIVAPFSGVVTAKLTEEGAYAAPGVPLLQITDISLLKFTINVPANELNEFNQSQAYSLTADVYPDAQLAGRVILKGSKANMGNSFPVQFSVTNTADLTIKSGMFGRVEVKSAGEKQQIVIPASAVVGTNIQPQVYTVKSGKAVLRNVTISGRFQNKVTVSKGLTEGDVIVTNGFVNPFDGANVNFK